MLYSLGNGPAKVQARQVLTALPGGAQIGILDLPVNLVAVNWQAPGRLDADLDRIGINPADMDLDLITDHDPFVDSACEN